jgi:hypothetical protein
MKIGRILFVAIALGLSFSGQVFSASKEIVPFYTPGSGGTAYFLGGAIAKIVNKYVPEVQVMVEATGGAPAIVKLIDEKYTRGQTALGLGVSKYFAVGYLGKPPFTKPYPELRIITFLYGAGMNLLVNKSSPIKTYQDLKEKRVALGAAGSGVYEIALELMENHGLTKDMYKPLWLGYKEVVEGLQDGSIDAGFVAGAYPIPAIQELNIRREIRILPVDDKVMKKMTAEQHYYSEILKSGAYRGIDKETPILVVGSLLITHSKATDERIYKITKAMFDHRDELMEIHPIAKEMSLQTRARTAVFPFHPGAEGYFKEAESSKK